MRPQAVGYDPSRMLAPRAPPPADGSLSRQAAWARRQSLGFGGSSAFMLPKPFTLAGAGRPIVTTGAQPEEMRPMVVDGQQHRSGGGGSGGGGVARDGGSDSEDSYASAQLVQRMRAARAKAAPLFEAAEAVLRQPAPPPTPGASQPQDDGSWPVGSGTPEATPGYTGSAAAGGDACGGVSGGNGFRLELIAMPSPTSSKENEVCTLTCRHTLHLPFSVPALVPS